MARYTVRINQHGYSTIVETRDEEMFEDAVAAARTLQAEYGDDFRAEIYDADDEDVIYVVDATGDASY